MSKGVTAVCGNEENRKNQTDSLCLLASRPIKSHQQGAYMHTLANCRCIIYSCIDTISNITSKLVDAVARMFATVPHVPPQCEKACGEWLSEWWQRGFQQACLAHGTAPVFGCVPLILWWLFWSINHMQFLSLATNIFSISSTRVQWSRQPWTTLCPCSLPAWWALSRSRWTICPWALQEVWVQCM